MNKDDLLEDMRSSIGTKDPLVFFSCLVDVFDHLFNQIDDLKKELKSVQLNSTLAIQWDSKVAKNLIDEEIMVLRKIGKQDDGTNFWEPEIKALQETYMQGKNIDDYVSFCAFWQDLLGYHPFLEKRK